MDGETTRRSLACGCFLAFPPGAFLPKKNVVAKRANKKQNAGNAFPLVTMKILGDDSTTFGL